LPGQILIVDDNRDNLMLMEYLLKAAGYEPRLASSGADGVRMAGVQPPDLVLLDIQMPGMDGYEAAAAMRAEPGLTGARLVAVTAFAMVGDRERILGAGFDGYLTKPISPENFVPNVEQFMSRELWSSGPALPRPMD
jgi:CheY-like chemotaxis protein